MSAPTLGAQASAPGCEEEELDSPSIHQCTGEPRASVLGRDRRRVVGRSSGCGGAGTASCHLGAHGARGDSDWEKAPAQGATFHLQGHFQASPCSHKDSEHATCGQNESSRAQGMEGTRIPGHGNIPTSPLTARQNFPVCSQQGKHPGQHHAGRSRLGRFGVPHAEHGQTSPVPAWQLP